jgi:hypothetical protein
VARSTCSSSGEADENQPAMTDAGGRCVERKEGIKLKNMDVRAISRGRTKERSQVGLRKNGQEGVEDRVLVNKVRWKSSKVDIDRACLSCDAPRISLIGPDA